MSKLLALDIATNVGSARLVRGQVPTFETLKLDGPDLTFKCGKLQAWLFAEYEREPFDGIAWERPILTPKDTVDLLELLYGLVGIVYGFIGSLRQDGIHLVWCEVSIDDVKRAVCGGPTKVDPATGNRRKIDKDDMLAAARRGMGWRVVTHHEADAGGVGLVAYERLWPKRIAA